MDVREKVLAAALQLFNTKGLAQTSVRDIAEAAGITHGHLRYHFKATSDTKGQLIKALFDQCEAKADAVVAKALSPPFSVEKLMDVIVGQARYFWEFRFLLDHMMQVCQQYPEVQTGMQGMYAKRDAELQGVIDLLVGAGLMQTDIPLDIRQQIIRHYHLVVDFGAPFTRIFSGEKPDEVQFREYVEMWLFPFWGYMTELGREELSKALDATLPRA